MSDLLAAQDTISPLVAVLWVLYPMTALVLIELLLRAFTDDDECQNLNFHELDSIITREIGRASCRERV